MFGATLVSRAPILYHTHPDGNSERLDSWTWDTHVERPPALDIMGRPWQTAWYMPHWPFWKLDWVT